MPDTLSTPWNAARIATPSVTVPAPPPPPLARVAWSGPARRTAPIALVQPWQGHEVRVALPRVTAVSTLGPTPAVPRPRPASETSTAADLPA
jgi:hypothetical protein